MQYFAAETRMQYTMLNTAERAQLMRSLATMPAYLYEQFHRLDAASACLPGAGGQFSPVEQVWHLADLEREGFAVRIRRLREEDNPRLADFDARKWRASVTIGRARCARGSRRLGLRVRRISRFSAPSPRTAGRARGFRKASASLGCATYPHFSCNMMRRIGSRSRNGSGPSARRGVSSARTLSPGAGSGSAGR